MSTTPSSPDLHATSPPANGAVFGSVNEEGRMDGFGRGGEGGGEGRTSGKGKGKGRAREKEQYGSSPIALLPLELLAHIFAHLPPHALGTCQLVCRGWNEVVGDEGSWRNAFETYYDVKAESLGRRMEPSSWRSEYIARVSLLRQWHRSRTPTIQHNPSLGAISALHIHLPSSSSPLPSSSSASPSPARASRSDTPTLSTSSLLSISLPLGAAVHSTPFKGSISKRPLLSSPIDHLGRPVGLPIVAATAFGVSPDGARLVWGMRDGTLRFSSATAPGQGGRGGVGGAVEQGEVRSLEGAHRAGSRVQLVSFSTAGGTGGGKVLKGLKQRMDVFVSAGSDGMVAIWSCAVPPTSSAAAGGDARERPPPAVKIWQARWDVALDAVAPSSGAAAGADGPTRPRIKATAVALDSGWLGRHHGRPASLAVGRSDGKVIVWPRVELDEEKRAEMESLGQGQRGEEPVVLEKGDAEGEEVDYLVFDPPTEGAASVAAAGTSGAALSLLVHQSSSSTFSRYVFPPPPPQTLASPPPSPPIRTIFGHPQGKEYLSSLTAFAVDFDPPLPSAAPGASQPQTPAEGKITFPLRPFALHTPSASSSSITLSLPPLSRTNSFSISLPLSSSASPSGAGGGGSAGDNSRFGRRRYVVAGDSLGRVFLWDWETKQGEEEQERGEVVGPVKQVQGLEVEGGGSSGKVTALEVTEVGVSVGGLDGTLRFYSTLGPPLPSPPIRTFRDRSAPRHPSRLLAQGLIPDDEEERWLVSHIRANREAVVAAIGGRVLAWRVSEEVKKPRGGVGKGGKLTARQERFKANLELQHQVRESISAISAESSARLEAHEDAQRQAREFGIPASMGNMTEEEAVAFATMLSLDDQEARLFEGDWEQVPEDLLDEGGDSFALDEDYLYERNKASTSGTNWSLDEDEAGGEQSSSLATSRTASRSQSLSVSPSPYTHLSTSPHALTPSSPRTWTPVSPSLLAVGSPPSSFNLNSKIQISPRLGPTYGSQGAQYVNEPVPDMSPELWPVATSPPPVASGSGSGFGQRRPSTAGPSPLGTNSSSPSLPPVPSTSSAAAAAFSTPIKRGWSDVARSTPANSSTNSPSALRSSPSPGSALSSTPPPAWPSPTLGASYTPPPKPTASSLLAEQLRNSELSAREEEERRRREREQEELDLAIALSLSQAEGGMRELEI